MIKRYFVFLITLTLLIVSCKTQEESLLDDFFNSENYINLTTNLKKEKLDSIINYLEHQSIDTLVNSNFLKISLEYYVIRDLEMSRKAADKSIQISKKLNDSILLAKGYFYKGDAFEKQKDSTLYYYSLSKKIYNDLNLNEDIAKMQFYIAYALFYDGNYIDCEVKLVDAIKRTEKSKEYKYRYSYLTLMGNCQEKLGNYDLALKYHTKALEIIKFINDEKVGFSYKVSSLINISNVYEKNEDYDKTINTLSNILSENKNNQISKKQFAIILNNIAYAKMKKGDFKGVENGFLEALKISEDINNNNEILYRKVNLGEYYLTVGNVRKAKTFLKEALNLSKEVGNYNEYLKSLKFLTKVDIQNKDFYNDEYMRVKDSIITAQITNRERYARIEYETSKLEEENEKLNQQNLIILLASLFSTSLFILIVLFNKLKSQRRENKLLNDKQVAEEEMIVLLEENRKNIEKAKINEQNRISKELHDGVLNDLYGVRLNLDYILSSDESYKDDAESYIESILKVENDIRKISHDLKIEEKFEKSEFKNLINSLVEEKNEINKINFKCEIDDKIDWSIFTTSDKLNIYRIIQEATQNVIKHSNASNCFISFNLINEDLIIFIEDDGVGFQLESDKEGIGLKNIKERVEELQGKVYFEENSNSGLRVKIVITT